MEDVVLVAAARTPFGKLGGGLSTLPAPDLGAVVIKAVLDRARVPATVRLTRGREIAAACGQLAVERDRGILAAPGSETR